MRYANSYVDTLCVYNCVIQVTPSGSVVSVGGLELLVVQCANVDYNVVCVY